MLTKRLIAVILLRDGRAVKSRQFKDYRDVGNPVSQSRIYYANGIDELVILNTQPEKGISPLMDVLEEVSKRCFIPVAVGGGIKCIGDVTQLFSKGCEKVVIRTHAELIPEIAQQFGKQAAVQCIDGPGQDNFPIRGAGVRIIDTEAGEVIVQNTMRDGMMCGYEPQLYECAVPLIRLGGCGNYQHMADAFERGADACAASSLYAFTDSNPHRAKSFLRNKGFNVR